MNSLQSKRTVIRSSVTAVAALSIGLLAAGQAAAQSSVPAATGPTQNLQDVTTRRSAAAHDPFSPFTYDVLGATPSLRLPVFIRKQRQIGVEGPLDVSSVDRPRNDVAAPATVAARPESTGAATRAQ